MAKLQRLIMVVFFAACLSSFLGCSTTSSNTPRESAGEYVDDSVITSKVKAALVGDMALKGFQINVETYQGVVQLSGFVDSADNVRRAGDLARNVNGVKDVKNNLLVK